MLTDTKLRPLLKGHSNKTPQKLTDANGLVALVRPSGHISFIYRFRWDGKQQTHTLGQYPIVSLKEARERRDQCRKWLADGFDPRQQARIEKQANKDKLTVRQAIEFWLDDKAPTAADNYRKQFGKHIFPQLGNLPIDQLDAGAWLKVFRDIKIGTHHRAAPNAASYIFGLTKTAMKYCRARQMITSTVLNDLSSNDAGEAVKKRSRVLSADELNALLQWTNNVGNPFYYRGLIKLLITFGCRLSELRQSDIKEWDMGAMVWTAPSKNTKTGVEIVRPIPAALLPVLNALIGDRKSGLLLGEEKTVGAVSNYVISISRRLGHDSWTAHDLRRTFATRLADLGIAHHVIESLLGHALPGVAGIYNRSKLLHEKQEALELWLSEGIEI
ncbi:MULTISPECIES: tyrosine-type recombinase/integrase [Klebsiella/Raoultella group]|uniref:tyrosine-type recombinase/integrase n=1 Tax=Klebsiella/Raoultella group TaxID=2890311 RepID=UPI0013EFB274|nr:integrase arm-type DNA-binding domain-containing protein [Raoultella ornithinolytica]